MSYFTFDELKNLGISLPKNPNNIKISKKVSFYNPHLMNFSNNIRIDDFCVLSGKISIGNFVHIGAGSSLNADVKNKNPLNIESHTNGIILEDFCGLSQKVSIFSSSDDYSGESLTNPTIPDTFKNIKQFKIIIEKHAIIGASSVILPNSKGIREGVSVGALSLVMRPTKPWGIYFGIPARRIAERNKNLLLLEKKFIKEFSTIGGGG